MKILNNIRNILFFYFTGRITDENELTKFEKKGNILVHLLTFFLSILLSEIYKPKIIVSGWGGRFIDNEFITIITYLFLLISLFFISDIRNKDYRKNNKNSLKYHIRTITLVFFYSGILYWIFFICNYINYGVIYFSPLDVIKITK